MIVNLRIRLMGRPSDKQDVLFMNGEYFTELLHRRKGDFQNREGAVHAKF